MAVATPESLLVDVGGVELGVVRWRGAPGSPVAFAVHGITANAWSWAAVARHLDGDVGLVAVDLRGRGASASAPEPFGMRQHADDVAAVIARFSAAPAVVVGHSMGTYVALCCAERHPAATGHLVLVDGGVALPMPDGASADEVLDATIGPAITRLRKVWSDRVAYRSMWSEHPALAGRLTPEIERYVLSDLVECEGGLRSSVSEAAVRHDGAELLTDPEMRSLLDRRIEPTIIIRAETGLLATPPPLLPAELIERFPQHDWRTVEGSNHYDVLVGETGAAAVADALRDAAG